MRQVEDGWLIESVTGLLRDVEVQAPHHGLLCCALTRPMVDGAVALQVVSHTTTNSCAAEIAGAPSAMSG